MTTQARADSDSAPESAIVGAAVALAVVVGLGFGAVSLGLLGGDTPLSAATPVVTAIRALSGGDPERILISGSVIAADEAAVVEAQVAKLFPGSELKNTARTVQEPKTPQAKKQAPTRSSTVRLSFAADAINEAWPRPRFGDVKRLELVWKEDKVVLRGAVFTAAAKETLDKAFAAMPKDSQGSAQIRLVQRPVVAAAELQQSISVAVAGRVIAFTPQPPAGAAPPVDKSGIAVDDPVVAAVAPLLKDLRGLEVWISAGADDRAIAMAQAEGVKSALVAQGADANGLRAVPAAKNNVLSLIVREKE